MTSEEPTLDGFLDPKFHRHGFAFTTMFRPPCLEGVRDRRVPQTGISKSRTSRAWQPPISFLFEFRLRRGGAITLTLAPNMNGIPLSFVMVATLATVAEGQAPVKPPILDIPPEPLRIVSSEDGEAPRIAEGLSSSYASKLPECDRIEVFLLKGDIKHGVAVDRFPIRPYFGTCTIMERKDLKGAEASKLCSLWRGLTFDNKGNVLSHLSDYGLRFYRADKLVFETSVSFSCHNFYYPRTAFPTKGDGSYAWHGFRNSDENGKAFLAFLNAIIPNKTAKPKS